MNDHDNDDHEEVRRSNNNSSNSSVNIWFRRLLFVVISLELEFFSFVSLDFSRFPIKFHVQPFLIIFFWSRPSPNTITLDAIRRDQKAENKNKKRLTSCECVCVAVCLCIQFKSRRCNQLADLDQIPCFFALFSLLFSVDLTFWFWIFFFLLSFRFESKAKHDFYSMKIDKFILGIFVCVFFSFTLCTESQQQHARFAMDAMTNGEWR